MAEIITGSKLCAKNQKHNPANHWEGSQRAKDCPWGRRYLGIVNDRHTWETQEQVIERNKNAKIS